MNPLDFIAAMVQLNREEAEEKARRELAFRKSRPHLGRSEDAIWAHANGQAGNFCCSICETTENLDMPGLCRGSECQSKAQKRE